MPLQAGELAPGLFVQTSNFMQVNALVLAGSRGVLVVDPVWFPDEIGALRQRAADAIAIAAVAAAAGVGAGTGTANGLATYVLWTHTDADHLVGWAEFGGARLIAGPGAAAKDWAASKAWIDKMDSDLLVPRREPFRLPERIDLAETIDLGDRLVHLHPAPGHTRDALMCLLPEQGTLVAGDYLMDVLPPIIRTSAAEYRRSLEAARTLCRTHRVERLVPGHGLPVRGGAEIEERIATDLAYVELLTRVVAEAKAGGVEKDGLFDRLRDLTYRGQAFGGQFADLHRRNAGLVFDGLSGSD